MKKTKTKACQNCKEEFTIDSEDFEFYEKMDAPTPTFCPECRAMRRFAVWNDRKIYKGKDSLTGEEIFTEYSDKSPATVCDKDFWNSDQWDAMEYERDYDFERPFFEQFSELMKEVPRQNLNDQNTVNCQYCKNVNDIKNCYLVFSALDAENCSYGYRLHTATDSVDCMSLTNGELCYQGFMLTDCYKANFSSYCENCQEIDFCYGLSNCSNCFGCTNLRHKKYHIFNKEYSKEEYFEKLKSFDLGSYAVVEELVKMTSKHHLKFPRKYARNKKNVRATGDYIENSKNITNCYSVQQGENLKHCQFLDSRYPKSDCYDETGFGVNIQRALDCLGVGKGTDRTKYCWHTYPACTDMEYCYNCKSSSNLFACAGLKHKSYCILNKQYTKEEYEKLVSRIKKHMNEMPYTDPSGNVYKYGEFFPPNLSPFAYNETIAQEFFPLTKDQVIAKGYRWFDKPKNTYSPTIKAKDLPDHINEVDEEVLKEIVECLNEEKGTCQGSGVFRMIASELKFYRKMNLALPRLCPDCRHAYRVKQRNPMRLHKRKCMCQSEKTSSKIYKNLVEHKHKEKPCPNTFQTTYPPEREEIVYCKECYQKEIE